MNISTNSIKLNLNKSRKEEKEDRWIEQDIIVPDNMPDAIKIISISSIPYINDIEINNNRAKIVGKINYSVIYKSGDEEMGIRGLNISYPYTTNIESNNIKNKDDVEIDSNLKNIIFSLPNERKIAIKNEITFNIRISETADVEIIKDFQKNDDIEYNKCKNSFNNVKAKKKCIIASSEDVMLGKDSSAMYEILKICPKIKDTEYKESYNKLMLKGVIVISLLYVGDNKKVCNEKVEVPFSSMIELDNISDKSKFDINYCIRDINARINPDIDQKTLNVDYKVESNVTMYEEEEIEYIEDFYSRTRELKYDVNDIKIASNHFDVEKEIIVTDTISDIIPDNNRIVEYSLDTNGVTITQEANGIKISGTAKLNILSQDKENGELDSNSIDIMVDENIPLEDTWKDSNVSIKIKDVKLNVIQNGNNIDLKVTVVVGINVESILDINSIGTIEDGPIDLKDISSINIYVVKPGDSVWKIAKKYKTSMDNIIKTNNLENPNMIDIGQKILVIR